MQYITYEEYKEMGGLLSEAAFKHNIDRACGIIDNATHGRIEAMLSVPVQAKALCRDLVDYIENNMNFKGTLASKSQSSGGVSESESYTAKNKDDIAQELDNIVCDYLLSVKDDKGTPLLYRGIVD